jgi:hypothetical protein
VSDTAFPLSALLPTNPVPTLTVEEAVRMVREEVGIQPQGPSKTTHIALADEQWGWEQLRDYVVTQIEKVNGIFPRNRITEKAIFTSFAKRWGPDAPKIARYAFEVADGYWKNAPIGVNRFCVASDQYFAEPIVEHLRAVAAARPSYT